NIPVAISQDDQYFSGIKTKESLERLLIQHPLEKLVNRRRVPRQVKLFKPIALQRGIHGLLQLKRETHRLVFERLFPTRFQLHRLDLTATRQRRPKRIGQE